MILKTETKKMKKIGKKFRKTFLKPGISYVIDVNFSVNIFFRSFVARRQFFFLAQRSNVVYNIETSNSTHGSYDVYQIVLRLG